MRTLRWLFTLSFFVLLVSAVTPKANADEWDKKTIVTFSGPVTVSGKPLDAGTYVFKLADSAADRHIVQIFNADESHIIYTILAIPDWRVVPTGKTVIKFSEKAGPYMTAEREMPAGGIPVKEWFYPGDNFGQEFLVKPAPVVAETTTTTETAQAETPPAATLETQPAPSPAPETAQVQPAPEEQAAPAPAPAAQPAEMPQTASPMPLIALIGLSSLGAALALREAVKRMS